MKYFLENQDLRATFDSFGGEIISIKNREGEEILWQKNPDIWNGTSPNLFPYIGKLYGEKYTYRGRLYELNSHDFLRNNEMKLHRKTKDSITFVFEDNEETYKKYPFKFRIKVHFKLKGNIVKVRYSVENKGKNRMYFGVGGHTAFNTLNFEDWVIEFLDNKDLNRICLSDDFFISDKTELYNKNSRQWNLEHKHFYKNAVIFSNPPKRLRLENKNCSRIIEVDYREYKYVAFWQKNNSQFLCIEPWTSLPGRQKVIEDFEKQESLISINKGGYYSIFYEIKLVK